MAKIRVIVVVGFGVFTVVGCNTPKTTIIRRQEVIVDPQTGRPLMVKIIEEVRVEKETKEKEEDSRGVSKVRKTPPADHAPHLPPKIPPRRGRYYSPVP